MSQLQYQDLLSSGGPRGKLAEIASTVMHEPNMKQMTKFLFVMSLAMCASQSGTYMNVCTPLFIAQYGWEEGGEEAVNEALMNVLPAVGLIFGSAWAAKLIGSGRARGFIVACAVGIFGSMLTFI